MMRRVLDDIDRFCVQSEESARRFIDLGADPGRVIGHRQPEVRLARAVVNARCRRARATACCATSACPPSRPVIVAGSTMKGEEALVLRAFRRVRSDRAEHAAGAGAATSRALRRSVEQLADQEGLEGRRGDPTCRSTPSRAPTSSSSTRIGELATIYQLATVVFVGGSLVATGGHNVLEPAVFGKPIVFGPHMENFAEIADAFVANGAGVQVSRRRASSTRRCCR